MADIEAQDLTSLTVDLLSAYFESNKIESDQLAGLIKTTHDALKALDAPEEPAQPEHVPAVSVRKSLSSPDHILSLIDGKPYKTLKRHLGTHGLTPAQYRERYKLPVDYPLVSKTYSEHRRKVAETLGLGRKVRSVSTETAVAKPVATPKKTSGRKTSAAKTAAAAPAKTAPAKAEAAPNGKAKAPAKAAPVAKAKAVRAPKAAPAVEVAPAAEAPKASAKRSRLKLNLSSLKGTTEPAAS
jgi:predicted transcriptional regulator